MDSGGRTETLKSKKPRNKFKTKIPGSKVKTDFSWFFTTLTITFMLSAIFNIVSSEVMEVVNMWIAVLILFIIIFIGILFDIIGTAVTTADETPFHSMAVHKVKGSKQAIKLIKSRDKVSNFCNDVIGDVCGIVSGSASAAVVGYVAVALKDINSLIISLVITALAASITVGGKALGKGFAMSQSNRIVFIVARVIALFDFAMPKKKKPNKQKK